MEKAIIIKNLNKTFDSKVKKKGFYNKFKNFLKPEIKKNIAVNNISFDIKPGELVGFVGPNGAGKSTTLKILSGILYPTSGHVSVLNLNPQKDRLKLTYKIGTIFGQKQQLWYHLPPIDSFELFSKIYNIPKNEYEKRLSELVKIFELEPYLNTPVRKLSLGERMRCEFVASLLHKPDVLFLDEPTIGLDIIAKRKMREHIKKLNEIDKTTIILTSHDMDDIEELCPRIIIINKGKILYDGSKEKIKDKLSLKRIEFVLDKKINNIPEFKNIKIISKDEYKFIIEIDKEKTSVQKVIEFYLSKFNVIDINIEDPPIEEIIELFYRK
ncbi:MAG: ATP-binding cassette domain-containing protein [Candidatus Pacearchaeota archaeon]|jgi:ABC-2 type transport system ATP-binding protein